MKESHQKGTRRTETCSRRHVGHRGNFQPAVRAGGQQSLPEKRMLNISWRAYFLGLGIFEADQLIDGWVIYVDVHVLVDRGAQDETTMPGIVRRQVGPSPPEWNSERSAYDDH